MTVTEEEIDGKCLPGRRIYIYIYIYKLGEYKR